MRRKILGSKMIDRIRRVAESLFLIGIGCLALAASGTLIWAVWPEKWRGEGGAAWVQAIGAIVAIAIAIWVPARQAQSARREARRDKADSIRAIRALGWLSVRATIDWWGSVFQGENSFDQEGFNRGMHAFKGIPMHTLPTPRAVRAVSELQGMLPKLLNAVQDARSAGAKGYDVTRIQEFHGNADRLIKEAASKLDLLTDVAQEIERGL